MAVHGPLPQRAGRRKGALAGCLPGPHAGSFSSMLSGSRTQLGGAGVQRCPMPHQPTRNSAQQPSPDVRRMHPMFRKGVPEGTDFLRLQVRRSPSMLPRSEVFFHPEPREVLDARVFDEADSGRSSNAARAAPVSDAGCAGPRGTEACTRARHRPGARFPREAGRRLRTRGTCVHVFRRSQRLLTMSTISRLQRPASAGFASMDTKTLFMLANVEPC